MSYQAVMGHPSADPELEVTAVRAGAACGSYTDSSLQQIEAVAGLVDYPEFVGLPTVLESPSQPPELAF